MKPIKITVIGPVKGLSPTMNRLVQAHLIIAAECWLFIEEEYGRGKLTPQQKKDCQEFVKEYIEEDITDFPLDVRAFKETVQHLQAESTAQACTGELLKKLQKHRS